MAVGKKTGGRQKGTPNKRSIALEEKVRAAAEIIESTLPEAFKGDAHALLMTVYKDPLHPMPLRIDAAKAAIAFEKPKLAAVQHSGDPDNPVESVTRIELTSPHDYGTGRTTPQIDPHLYGTG
jgi:hypothetical protein